VKDKPRIFLPGTPEFTQGFLFRGIKFPPPSVSELIQSSCLGRNVQPPGQQSRTVFGDSRQGRRGNTNQGHVGPQCHQLEQAYLVIKSRVDSRMSSVRSVYLCGPLLHTVRGRAG